MQVDLDTKLLDPHGKESSDQATVGTASYSALSAPLPEDQGMSMDQKLKIYRLVQKVAAGGKADLSAEEITTIKSRAAKALPMVWFGALADLLDPTVAPVPLKPGEPKEASAA